MVSSRKPKSRAAAQPSILPEDAARAAAAILESVPAAMRAIRARMREGRPAGLSVPQFRALLYIRRHPAGPLSGVAEHLGTSMPAASELVSRLVAHGLVVREPDPASRRRVRLDLSPAGRTALQAAEARTEDWLVDLLAHEDPARVAALVEGLGHLRDLVAGAREDYPSTTDTRTSRPSQRSAPGQ
jgi:DNA-binding MarR family transcriptional regulator